MPTGELEGVLHLPEASAVGACVVLHGFGGHPDQPHIVTTCATLADSGVAALRFAYRDHEPPRMTLDSSLADTAGAVRLLKAHPEIPERLERRHRQETLRSGEMADKDEADGKRAHAVERRNTFS